MSPCLGCNIWVCDSRNQGNLVPLLKMARSGWKRFLDPNIVVKMVGIKTHIPFVRGATKAYASGIFTGSSSSFS